MFTGLVQAVGTVHSFSKTDTGARLLIDPQQWNVQPKHGDSIAVNGCCLTHAPRESDPPRLLAFDVIQQTLAATTLGTLREQARVNLESCVTPTTAMGGHFVQGHIDAVGTIVSIQNDAADFRMRVKLSPQSMPCITPRGSITIEGVSLTIATVDVANHTFEVALIPTTLADTNLGLRKQGDAINIETDILARTTIHFLSHYAKPTQ